MNGPVTAMDDVRRLCLQAECLGQALVARALCFPDGIHVSLYGGHLPHIGAVTIARAADDVQTTLFPGHRDDVVSRRWAWRLIEAGCLPAVVEVGIHYDDLNREGIETVVRAADRLLERLISEIDKR